ncbi:MAG TPA: TetR family transcriptional regulator [Solirubrobacteraceae bacterium]|nr:TetR family transcriptional regulator [Solirubrobacteraceae bacterium]
MSTRASKSSGGVNRRRTQAERRRATRRALLEAALLRMEAGDSFDTLSLRGLTRAAGVVPTAFYRHFASMDELGLALVDESFGTLRAMLRQARSGEAPPEQVIQASVGPIITYVREQRQHFAFIARARSTGNPILRHAIRTEIRLLTSELATDLTRFPVLAPWSTDDLQMVAALLVSAMISTVEAILDTPPEDLDAQEEIRHVAEKQLRLIVFGIPQWRSS